MADGTAAILQGMPAHHFLAYTPLTSPSFQGHDRRRMARRVAPTVGPSCCVSTMRACVCWSGYGPPHRAQCQRCSRAAGPCAGFGPGVSGHCTPDRSSPHPVPHAAPTGTLSCMPFHMQTCLYLCSYACGHAGHHFGPARVSWLPGKAVCVRACCSSLSPVCIAYPRYVCALLVRSSVAGSRGWCFPCDMAVTWRQTLSSS